MHGIELLVGAESRRPIEYSPGLTEHIGGSSNTYILYAPNKRLDAQVWLPSSENTSYIPYTHT